MDITLPYNWKPRKYQLEAFKAFDNGCNRLVLRWARRSGKDETALHLAAKAAFTRIGNYWHMLPEYAQARKAIWLATNPHTGKRRIDEAFPKELRKRTNDQEMFIEFINGSTWQVLGSDRYNSLVGASPAGIVFSEYALANPNAWDYFRPMLAENNGFAMFISTVRGYNHFWHIGEYAKEDNNWFFSQVNADETGAFSPEKLEQELKEVQARWGEDDGLAIFRQEYFNDPNAAAPGAYYAKLLTKAEEEGRITTVNWDPMIPVTTAWDLGIGDSTAIWFAQMVHNEVRLIDYYEASGVGLEHYTKMLATKPYTYHEHILPHDAEVSELGTGKRRIDILRQLGLARLRVLPRASVEDGIQAVRTMLYNTWFDKTKCKQGLEYLRQYQKEYDEKLQTFKDRPLHDFTSHCADAARYLAQGIKPAQDKRRPIQADMDYKIY